jgi:flagellar L-ring protein precursor FlgH
MKMNELTVLIFTALAVLITAGCWQTKTVTRPNVVAVPLQPAPEAAPGAIWRGENDKSMIFTDKKARYVNDIVTILVAEAASGGNKASTGTSRNASTSANIDAFLGLDNYIIGKNANLGGEIAIGGKHTNSMKGQGDTSRNNTLVARISARVIRVMDNGDLMIEGRRQVTINAEDQYLIISGIIRPQDITAENTVASQYISDAHIIFTGTGVINDKMRPGWATRIVDWVWPF